MNDSNRPVVRQCSKCSGDVYLTGTTICRPCHLERARQYANERYAKNKEVEKERSRLWRINNKEAYKKSERKQNLRKMGVTPEWYDKKFAEQDGLCEICGNDGLDGFRTRLSIDHSHACCPKGKSCDNCRRGLICNKCNSMLGYAKDIPEVLERAAEYLERWGK